MRAPGSATRRSWAAMARPLEWMAAVRDHPERPASMQCHVLYSLALRLRWSTDRDGAEGTGFASGRQLAGDACASDRTVKRATAWARGHSLLVLTRRGHRISAERNVASEWRLTLPVDNQATQRATSGTLATQGANGSRPKVPMAATQGDSGAPPSRSRSSRPRSSARASRARAGSARAGAQKTGVDTAGWCAYCRSLDHEHCANLHQAGAQCKCACSTGECEPCYLDGDHERCTGLAFGSSCDGYPCECVRCHSSDDINDALKKHCAECQRCAATFGEFE